jgi:hypothetical protein
MSNSYSAALRAGDWVEVKGAAEILATLDERGCLDALPFMPEMLPYCGKRFRVFKSAHKSCDTIETYTGRRLDDTVHLEALRCSGAAHGGCQADCLLFWKNAWLRRVNGPEARAADPAPLPRAETGARARCTIEGLQAATRAPVSGAEDADAERYSCQATELVRASKPLAWWDLRSYIKDLTSGNVSPWKMATYMLLAGLNMLARLHWRGRPAVYPYVRGLAGDKTPAETLDLKPGELVEVRSRKEIMRTLNRSQKNRGLFFDVEQVPYCGKTFRIQSKVERIINEKTGVMMKMPGACIVLSGTTCSGCYSRNRLFCPRSVHAYWHEIWLRRAPNETNKGAG